MNQYVKQYQKSNIETASREQILIMLYDGCIQFMNQAKVALNEKNYEQLNKNLLSAQRILEEFINTLDHEVAPQLTANLQSLYEYFIRRLIHANMKKKMEPIDEVLGLVKNLRNTWKKAIDIYHQENSGDYSNSNNGSSYQKTSEEYYDDEEDDEEDDDEDENKNRIGEYEA